MSLTPPQGAETRPDLYVVARFLEKLISKGGSCRKTELQMAVGLNFNVYTRYLGWLENKNLIRTEAKDDGSKIISIAPKGLESYKTLVGWIREVVGSP